MRKLKTEIRNPGIWLWGPFRDPWGPPTDTRLVPKFAPGTRGSFAISGRPLPYPRTRESGFPPGSRHSEKKIGKSFCWGQYYVISILVKMIGIFKIILPVDINQW